MVNRMTFKQFLFIIPLLALIGVFSFYPIVSSFVYTFFDYRTNDQQHAQLYVQGAFNAELFYEDCKYLAYYIGDDVALVDAEDAAVLAEVGDDVRAFMAPYEGAVGTQGASAEETEAAIAFVDDIEARLNAVYAKYPDVVFNTKDKAAVWLEEMRTCVIESNFSGLANYQRLLQDSRFWRTMGTTFIFTAISVAVELVLGMALAMIMNKAIKGIGLVRTTALIPWAIPTAVSALIWSYLYDGSNGIIAEIFSRVGFIGAPQDMLLSSGGALSAAILADIWKTTPYMALLLLAGLQVIDRGLYESASIDGSGPVKTFFRITLPLMKPSILVALLFRMLDAFRVYDLIAILTGGGPGGATETLSVYSYKLMVGQSNYGYGSTVVVAMFICVAVIAFVFIKGLGAEVVSNDD